MSEINIEEITPNINIDTSTRNYHLPIASADTLGGIKVGSNLTIEEDGTLNAESTEYNLPVATASTLGGIKVGSNLNIDDGVLTAAVDSVLANSTNPIQNSAVNSAISTLTTTTQTLTNNLGNLSSSVTLLSGTVSSNTDDITSLQNDVSGLGDDVDTNTNNIENNTNDISDLNGSISLLGDRVTATEDAITELQTNVTGLLPLAASSVDEITYSSLLPATSWTSGSILVVKRGKVGYIYFDLEGNITIAANTSVVLYNFNDLVPSVKATATLLTDSGVILGELDDYSYNLSLVNMGSQPITLTKVKGSIPLVFE